MINRILIRIKVVQMLYSYLLVEKDFSIETQPTPPTKEKRFAYSVYLDLLALMIYLSREIKRRDGSMPLAETRFIIKMQNDDRIRTLLNRYKVEDFPLQAAIAPLADKIRESGIYKLYVKDSKRGYNSDIDVWKEIFKQIIFPARELNGILSKMPGYTLRAVDQAGELVDKTFVNFYSSRGDINEALKTLDVSLGAARELYFQLLQLPVDITELQLRRIEDNRNKYLPTDEDRNPNLRFVENRLVAALRNNRVIDNYVIDHDISWINNDYPMLASISKAVLESETYQEYMSLPMTDFHTDYELWRNLYKQVIFRNNNFLEELEDKSVFWNDDIEIIGTFMLKTLKRFDEANAMGYGVNDERMEPVMPMFKDEEDARFGAELFTAVVQNKEAYMQLIDKYVNRAQWETERLAFMDVVIMLTAIAELLCFPKIPTLVTVNEYIEMAKSYSTPKSGSFVHGILGSIINALREEGRLNKE